MLISGYVSTCILSSADEFVSALDKVVYMNNRRFLPFSHPSRKASKKFPNAKAETLPPPDTLTQEEVILNNLAYENAKNKHKLQDLQQPQAVKAFHASCFSLDMT